MLPICYITVSINNQVVALDSDDLEELAQHKLKQNNLSFDDADDQIHTYAQKFLNEFKYNFKDKDWEIQTPSLAFTCNINLGKDKGIYGSIKVYYTDGAKEFCFQASEFVLYLSHNYNVSPQVIKNLMLGSFELNGTSVIPLSRIHQVLKKYSSLEEVRILLSKIEMDLDYYKLKLGLENLINSPV